MSYRPHRLGTGPLTAGRVIGDALAMLRQSFWRIAGVAAVFFAVPALLVAGSRAALESLGPDPGSVPVVVAFAIALVGVGLRILGPVGFAGFLEEAVAKEYLYGTHHRLRHVLEVLPWRALIIADILVAGSTAIGLAILVVPGLIIYGLFAMVGPVLVSERAGVRESFRRTLRLSRAAFGLVVVLIIVPFGLEHLLHELLLETLHSAGLGAQVLVEWLAATLIGSGLGLIKVALAAELMARNPIRPKPSSDHTAVPQAESAI